MAAATARIWLCLTAIPVAIALTCPDVIAAEMNLLAPSYYGTASDPGPWSALQANWPTNGSRGMIIINEDNGPGAGPDSTLRSNVQSMRAQDNGQPNMLAYVDLPEANDANGQPTWGFDPYEKAQEIDKWLTWYDPIQGFFFDDLAREGSGAQSFDLDYIEGVVLHLMQVRHPTIVVMNAAGNYTTTAGLYYCVGGIVASHGGQFIVVTVETYEDRYRSGVMNDINTHAYDFSANGALNWVYGYPASTFAGLVHDGTAGNVLSDLSTLADYNIGVSFVTDQQESANPWDPGPSADVWEYLGDFTGSWQDWYFPGGSFQSLSMGCPTPYQL